MDELLQRLEYQLKGLIDHHNQLVHLNQQLNQGKSALLAREKTLVHQQQKAISTLEIMISKLKEIEKTI